VRNPFSFNRSISRVEYALASLVVFFSQHLAAYLICAGAGARLKIEWWFWLNPLRAVAIVFYPMAPPWWVAPSGMLVMVLAEALLVTLAFRRALSTRGNQVIAALAVAPIAQSFIILWFCLAPERGDAFPEPTLKRPGSSARLVTQGVLIGLAISIGAVALSTLVFHLYGTGLFLASPIVIGLATAWVANRDGDLGGLRTAMLVLCALVLGGVALIGFSLEGVICLVFASPLIAIMGLFGGLIGRAIALVGRHARVLTVTSIAILPLLISGEGMFPPKAEFASVESVDVAAPPSAVWDAVVHMGPIPDAPPAPFRWGLAYPVRGEIFGSGVGAVRRGVFSTGVAYERVTEWSPNRSLSFVVLSNPPSMRELSPYKHVNAPHVVGYFRTLDARFTITPLPSGRTRLALATRHELDLEPALYWLPFAEWAVHVNKTRVLRHFGHQAESSAGVLTRRVD
jgi:hypothetical protein